MRPKLCPGTKETAESDSRNAIQGISKEHVIAFFQMYQQKISWASLSLKGNLLKHTENLIELNNGNPSSSNKSWRQGFPCQLVSHSFSGLCLSSQRLNISFFPRFTWTNLDFGSCLFLCVRTSATARSAGFLLSSVSQHYQVAD